MSIKSWVVLAALFVILIFTYDFLTKTPSRRAPGTQRAKVDAASWLEYTAPDKSFKAKFPSVPQYAVASDDSPFGLASGKVTYHVYAAQGNDGSTFLVKVVHYGQPISKLDRELLFDDVQKDMLANNPGTLLVNTKKLTYNGHPSVDFTLEGDGYALKSRVFYTDDILYILTVIDRSAKSLEKDFDIFTGAFALVEK